MKVMKALVISFSMYSRIPVPQFPWKEEHMKYALCFFPWVGAVTGVLLWLWRWLCGTCEIGRLCQVMIGAAIPLLVTGGIHVDGFMDTMDAFHSFLPKEKKLDIMKDPHIGAFSVVALAVFGLLYLGALSEISDPAPFGIFCAGFFLARCLSGIGAVTFPSAKKDGLLYTFSGSADKRIVKAALYVQTLVCVGFMLLLSVRDGCIVAAAAFCVFGYYYYRCKKELGGITGDTAGWFVVICEGCMTVCAAVLGWLL